MRNVMQRQKGFTLVEFLIYIAILVVVMTVVATALIGLGRAYAKAKAIRAVNQAGVHVLDRITREARKAKTIDVAANGQDVTITLHDVPATFAEAVRKDGAISHWNFEEKGGDLIDQIGNVNGKVTNILPTERNQTAMVGKGYKFDPTHASIIRLGEGMYDQYAKGAIEFIVSPQQGSGSFYNTVFAVQKASTYAAGQWSDYVWAVGSGKGSSVPTGYTAFGAFGQNGLFGDFLHYSPSGCGNNWAAACTDASYPIALSGKDAFYHVVVESEEGKGTRIFVNGKFDGYADTARWFDYGETASWEKSYNIGNAQHISTYSTLAFGGVIDEIAVYPVPQADTVWAEHYRAAFPTINGGGTLVDKIITIKDGLLKIQTGSEIELPLSSDAVAIASVAVQKLGSLGDEGLSIEFTATAGTGSAQSSASFQSIIAPRKQE